MSSNTQTETVTVRTSSPRLLTPTTQQIPLLADNLSKPLSLAHTASVLLYYYLRSSALVSDPLPTLLQDLIPLATLQAVFCAICLPSAGNWYSGTGDAGRGGRILEGTATGRNVKGATTTGAGSVRRRVGAAVPAKSVVSARQTTDAVGVSGGPIEKRILPTILSMLLSVTVPPVPLMLLALVLGAPLYPTNLLPHTLALSVHVSFLVFMPIFYTHGVSSAAWRDVAAAWLPFDEAGVWGGAVGAMVGGWVGAVPMALDWDRDWQKWPCTVVWGAVGGWALGRILTGALKLGVGTRISLSEGGRVDGEEEKRK